MKYSKKEIYDKYKDRISASGFHKIWNYNTYTEVGQELNTKEVIYYYKHYRETGTANKKCMFTRDDIIEIRNLYYIDLVSSKEISELYGCSSSTISRIVSNKVYTDVPMPEPSLKYRRKNHIFTKEEIDSFIEIFVQSKLSIKNFWKTIKDDFSNLFGGYSESQFRIFINKELYNRGLEYKTNNKWNFEIIKIN